MRTWKSLPLSLRIYLVTSASISVATFFGVLIAGFFFGVDPATFHGWLGFGAPFD